MNIRGSLDLESGLSPLAMHASISRGRSHPEDEHSLRAPYQRDRDRIIHCAAFRRLEYKTQVFVNHEGDNYRTRLTHTLEVAQISRSIARALGLNEDLTEAIALAHDLGHTPFGHSGEEALNDLMADDGGFEHNRHGLRVVDRLELRYPGFAGLNLTYEVREAFLKHTTSYDTPAAEQAHEFRPEETIHLEGQIVAAADEIAYDNHDIDDGLSSGLLDWDELEQVPLWRRALDRSSERNGPLEGRMLQAQAVRLLINIMVEDIIASTVDRIAESGVKSAGDVRTLGRSLVLPSDPITAEKTALEEYLHEKLYRHYRVCRMTNKARHFVKEMFEEYVDHPDDLPPEYQQIASAEGTGRAVADYIAGMTDRYAQEEYQRLFHPFEKV